jgi:hypothetical protein
MEMFALVHVKGSATNVLYLCLGDIVQQGLLVSALSRELSHGIMSTIIEYLGERDGKHNRVP